jgi:nucleoside-diphosphate-sugar epimerase
MILDYGQNMYHYSRESLKAELVCDNTKILKNTKWKPEIEIDQGLDMTIDWLRKFKDLYKHNIYHI